MKRIKLFIKQEEKNTLSLLLWLGDDCHVESGVSEILLVILNILRQNKASFLKIVEKRCSQLS